MARRSRGRKPRRVMSPRPRSTGRHRWPSTARREGAGRGAELIPLMSLRGSAHSPRRPQRRRQLRRRCGQRMTSIGDDSSPSVERSADVAKQVPARVAVPYRARRIRTRGTIAAARPVRRRPAIARLRDLRGQSTRGTRTISVPTSSSVLHHALEADEILTKVVPERRSRHRCLCAGDGACHGDFAWSLPRLVAPGGDVRIASSTFRSAVRAVEAEAAMRQGRRSTGCRLPRPGTDRRPARKPRIAARSRRCWSGEH